jgi:hypothetical protein
MKIDWTYENIQSLLNADTDEEFQVLFPGANLETLKRRKREFKNMGTVSAQPEEIPDELESGSISLTGDSGVIKTGQVKDPITDWTDTIKLWGLDPELFEVIQPVTMKAWGKPGEFRYSYAARIQKKEAVAKPIEDTLDIAGWRETLKAITANPPKKNYNGSGLTYTILVADPQLGKPGTQDSLANWTNGIEGHADRVRNLADAGLPINEIALAFMGDEHEGAVGNYASQPYEIEMSYSKQIELDFDMRVWSIKHLLELAMPMKVSSVPSNHGEHTRFGSNKVLTSIYDNSSTMVASLTKKVFEGTHEGDMLSWYIAEDRQDTNLELNGIKANFTHGHIANGSGPKTGGISSKNAIEKQILGRFEEIGNTELFFTAHYHHFNTLEDRGRTFFGCPALEAEKSSRWFYDGSGVWSRPGMLGMAVGSAAGERGWTELSVI